MNVTDGLYLAVSNIIGVRVTPNNLRAVMDDVAASGGITSRVKTEILQEILLAIAELDEKIDKHHDK